MTPGEVTIFGSSDEILLKRYHAVPQDHALFKSKVILVSDVHDRHNGFVILPVPEGLRGNPNVFSGRRVGIRECRFQL